MPHCDARGHARGSLVAGGLARLGLYSHIPIRIGQLRKDPAQAFSPLLVDHVEVGVRFLDVALYPDLEAVPVVDEQVDRKPHRDVAAHGRVERDQDALRRLEQPRTRFDDPVDDGFAVLALAHLEIGRLLRRLDEVALGVDEKKTLMLAQNLAADDERRRSW